MSTQFPDGIPDRGPAEKRAVATVPARAAGADGSGERQPAADLRGSPAPSLTIQIGDKKHVVPADELTNPDLLAELREGAGQTDGPMIFKCSDFLTMPADARRELLAAAAALQDRCVLQLSANGAEHGDAFAAVLSTIEKSDDLNRTKTAIQAAVEAAVLVHPDGLDLACQKIVDRCKEMGIKGVNRVPVR